MFSYGFYKHLLIQSLSKLQETVSKSSESLLWLVLQIQTIFFHSSSNLEEHNPSL